MINKNYYKFLYLLPLFIINDVHAIGNIYGKADIGFLMPGNEVKSDQRFYKISGKKGKL